MQPVVSFEIYGQDDRVDTSKVMSLLNSSPECIVATDRSGNTLLHEVAVSDYPELVDYIIRLGADVNAKGLGQQTPLHVWVGDMSLHSVPVGEVLLNNGANVESTDYRGLTPLGVVARKRQPTSIHVIDCLLQHGAVLDLNSALWMHRFDYVRQQLSKSPHLLKSGRSALVPFPNQLFYDALFSGSLAVMELLLDSGVAIDTSERESPIELAIRNPRLRHCIPFLLEKGIKLPSRTSTGETPLELAEKMDIGPQMIEQIRHYHLLPE